MKKAKNEEMSGLVKYSAKNNMTVSLKGYWCVTILIAKSRRGCRGSNMNSDLDMLNL